jgi:hypothetical protein
VGSIDRLTIHRMDHVAGLQAGGTELVGEVERWDNSFRLCYVRGLDGIIVELAERIG